MFRARTAIPLALCASASIAAAAPDSLNVTVLGNANISSWHADLWGYASGGTEIAILCTLTGTAFFDVTDPADPTQVAFVGGAQALARDVKTFGHYAYIVADVSGASGLQIVSLANPLSPTLVDERTTEFVRAHNLWIDEAAALLFVVGSGFTTWIYSLADPEDPTLLRAFSDYYVHDLYSANGIAYVCDINAGELVTWDLSTLPGAPVELGRAPTDSAFTHNVWVTADGATALTTDEVSGGHITIFDVSDPTDLVRIGSWSHPTDPTATVHNVCIVGETAMIGWYKAGFVVLDISTPAAPVRVAYYDTSPLTGGGFDGGWGCYPFAPSGVVYYSDITNGLYLFEVTPSAVGVPAPVTPALPLRVGPNPATASAALDFHVPRAERVRLEMFDVSGRRIARLLDERLGAGTYRHVLSRDTRRTGRLAPGVYVLRLAVGSDVRSGKVVFTD